MTPPPGCEEYEEGIVYKCLRPIYGVPSSARALWAGGQNGAKIIVSAHIDDLLIVCSDLNVMKKFKEDFLKRFEGTDEGDVEQYLGCEVIYDREASTVTLRQKVYAERVLRLYGMWGCAQVKKPLEPGTRLSKADCPQHVDPALHCRYRGIIGHLSFLVGCTQADLAFAYTELSKFVQYPGVKHMRAAERVLQYLMGTYNQGITYRRLDQLRRNVLEGWVDSDYAADPDSSWSVTGYVMSMNGGPVSWRAKHQG
eukprot:512003-Rhodomonas_salina.1